MDRYLFAASPVACGRCGDVRPCLLERILGGNRPVCPECLKEAYGRVESVSLALKDGGTERWPTGRH